jgi:transposase
MEKIDARTLKPEVQEQLRKQAIHLRQKGQSVEQIAAILDVNSRTVYRWWQLYRRGGVKSIRIRRRGRPTGACRRLTVEQEKQIQRLIRDKQPDQMKLPFALWSRIAVQQLIQQLWAMRMPIRTVGGYLKRWGFTPQKPFRRAYEQNPKLVKQWLEEQYPGIAQRAKQEDAEIQWADETGLCNGSYYGRSYAPRGQTPAIRLPARPQRINLISTVTNQGKVRFMVYRDTMTAQTMIRFMRRLIKDVGRKVFLIVDNLRVHHSKLVREWLEEHREQIEVFYLPSYSPELNPDEYLNCDLKVGVHTGVPATSKSQLARKAIGHLRMLQKRPARVAKYFKHPKIAYAA